MATISVGKVLSWHLRADGTAYDTSADTMSIWLDLQNIPIADYSFTMTETVALNKENAEIKVIGTCAPI